MHMQAMSTIRTVCVYCGSGPGTDPAFMDAARRFGKILATERVGLVYGGGSRGLMGAVATSVLDHGGHVTGIIPEFLQNREQTLRRAQEIIGHAIDYIAEELAGEGYSFGNEDGRASAIQILLSRSRLVHLECPEI